MKGWRAACWSLILLGISAAGRAEFDQCRLIDQVLNRLGNAMAINRLIIKALTARLSLRRVMLWPNRTRATGAPSANASKPAAMAGNGTDWLTGCCLTDSLAHWLTGSLAHWLTPGKLVKR